MQPGCKMQKVSRTAQQYGRRLGLAGLTCLALLTGACEREARFVVAEDHASESPERMRPIKIVGSSTVAPFATAAAEYFGAATPFRTPVVETTGTGGGIKLFCSDPGIASPSIADASRSMTRAEREACEANGVTGILEVLIGYDGIVLVSAKDGPQFPLTLTQVYLALAREVPAGDSIIPNPNRTWSDLDPGLPDYRIEVFGPPPTSGTRDAFSSLALEAGARRLPALASLEAAAGTAFIIQAHSLRSDGAWVDFGENDTAIVRSLIRSKTALGVTGFSYLDQSSDRIQGHPVNGVAPTHQTIADGTYPMSRSLFIYVKLEHIGAIPGLGDFVELFLSDAALGDGGFLTERGLIPPPEHLRNEALGRVQAVNP